MRKLLIFLFVSLSVILSAQPTVYSTFNGYADLQITGAGPTYNFSISNFNGTSRNQVDGPWQAYDIAVGDVVWADCARFIVTNVVTSSFATAMLEVQIPAQDVLYGFTIPIGTTTRCAIVREIAGGSFFAQPPPADGNNGALSGVDNSLYACMSAHYATYSLTTYNTINEIWDYTGTTGVAPAVPASSYPGQLWKNSVGEVFYSDGVSWLSSGSEVKLTNVSQQGLPSGIYKLAVDTLGIDTMYVANNGIFRRFQAGGSTIDSVNVITSTNGISVKVNTLQSTFKKLPVEGLAQSGAGPGYIPVWSGFGWVTVPLIFAANDTGTSVLTSNTLSFYSSATINPYAAGLNGKMRFLVRNNSLDSSHVKDFSIRLRELNQSGASLNNVSAWNGSQWVPSSLTSLGGVTGTGTLNYVPKWSPDGTTLSNSRLFDNGSQAIFNYQGVVHDYTFSVDNTLSGASHGVYIKGKNSASAYPQMLRLEHPALGSYMNLGYVTNGQMDWVIGSTTGQNGGQLSWRNTSTGNDYMRLGSGFASTNSASVMGRVGVHLAYDMINAGSSGGFEVVSGSQGGRFGTDGTARLYMDFNGNTAIGNNRTVNARLHVVGGGATSATWTAQFHNSTGSNNALMIRDDGRVGIGTNAPLAPLHIAANNAQYYLYLDNTSGNGDFFRVSVSDGSEVAANQVLLRTKNNGIRLTGTSTLLLVPQIETNANNQTFSIFGGYSANTVGNSIILGPNTGNGGNFNATTGTQNTLILGRGNNGVTETWAPTSGNANYNQMTIQHVINTTGTYSGTIRGLFINPTLTSTTGATYFALDVNAGNVRFGGLTGTGTQLATLSPTGVLGRATGTADVNSLVDGVGVANQWAFWSDANTIGTSNALVNNSGHIDLANASSLQLPSRGNMVNTARALFTRSDMGDRPFYRLSNGSYLPVLLGYDFISSQYANWTSAKPNIPELYDILAPVGHWIVSDVGSTAAGGTLVRTWTANTAYNPSGQTYTPGQMFFHFWAGQYPQAISVRIQNESGTWFGPFSVNMTSVSSFDRGASNGTFFNVYKWDVQSSGNFLRKIEVTFTNPAATTLNLTGVHYFPDNPEGWYDPYPFISKSAYDIRLSNRFTFYDGSSNTVIGRLGNSSNFLLPAVGGSNAILGLGTSTPLANTALTTVNSVADNSSYFSIRARNTANSEVFSVRGDASVGVGRHDYGANNRMWIQGLGSTSGTNTLAVHNSTGTSNSLVVRDDGNIGIGTATLGSKVNINGDLNVSTLSATANRLGGWSSGNVATAVTLGTNLSLSGNVLNATGGITLDSLFFRADSLGGFVKLNTTQSAKTLIHYTALDRGVAQSGALMFFDATKNRWNPANNGLHWSNSNRGFGIGTTTPTQFTGFTGTTAPFINIVGASNSRPQVHLDNGSTQSMFGLANSIAYWASRGSARLFFNSTAASGGTFQINNSNAGGFTSFYIGSDNKTLIGDNGTLVAGSTRFGVVGAGNTNTTWTAQFHNSTGTNLGFGIMDDGTLQASAYANTVNTTGLPVNVLTTSSTGVVQSHPISEVFTTAMREETFTATASQTSFTIAYSAPAVSGTSVPVRVYRNGIRLNYVASGPNNYQFTYSGTTITTSACIAGDLITVEYLN